MQCVRAEFVLGGFYTYRTPCAAIDGAGARQRVGAAVKVGAYHVADHDKFPRTVRELCRGLSVSLKVIEEALVVGLRRRGNHERGRDWGANYGDQSKHHSC